MLKNHCDTFFQSLATMPLASRCSPFWAWLLIFYFLTYKAIVPPFAISTFFNFFFFFIFDAHAGLPFRHIFKVFFLVFFYLFCLLACPAYP
jgi:hypothetical protein